MSLWHKTNPEGWYAIKQRNQTKPNKYNIEEISWQIKIGETSDRKVRNVTWDYEGTVIGVKFRGR